MHWMQVYDPFGHWWLSTLVAALPILVLFGLLAGVKSETALVRDRWRSDGHARSSSRIQNAAGS